MSPRFKRSPIKTLLALAAAGLVLSACADRFGEPISPTPEPQVSGLQRYLDDGREHFANDRIGLALASFRSALRYDPNSVRALNGVAASYDRLHRFDLADRFYQLALAVEPESSQTLNNLAYSYMLRGDPQTAQRYLKDARRGLDAAPEGWRQIVDANAGRITTGDVEEALPPTLEMAEARPEVGPPLDLLTPRPVATASADRARRGWIERHREDAAILVVSRLDRLEERLRATPGGPEILSYYPQIAEVGEDALVAAWDESPFLISEQAELAAAGFDTGAEPAAADPWMTGSADEYDINELMAMLNTPMMLQETD